MAFRATDTCCGLSPADGGRSPTNSWPPSIGSAPDAFVHTLASHRPPGAGGELPAPGHDHHRGGRCQEGPGADEPAEIAKREEERPLAAIEVPSRRPEQFGGAHHMGLG